MHGELQCAFDHLEHVIGQLPAQVLEYHGAALSGAVNKAKHLADTLDATAAAELAKRKEELFAAEDSAIVRDLKAVLKRLK